MPRPTGSTAQERIMLRANAIGKVKELEGNTARSRILSRAAEMGEVKTAETAPQYAEQTREPYSIHAFGAGDDTGAANLMEKAWQTGKAGVLSVVGALKELESQASPVTREQSMGQFSGFGDLGRAVSESKKTGESIDAITNRLETERLQRREAQKKALQDKATELFDKSAMAQEQAKEGLSPVGGFMVDMGVTGIQMAGDALMNAVAPGSGLFMMGLRSYGQAANEARREGKSEEQQFVAGLKSAGIETLTEKMFGAFGKIYGKAGADELVEKLVTKLTSNKTGQALLTWIVNGAGEGVEEVTSDILNPLADRILQLDDGNGPVYSVDDAAQMGYDFLLGAAMGLVGGSVQAGRGVKQGKAQTAESAYYENLQKNGLFNDASAEKAAKASEAMRRAMPREYTEMYRSAYARPLSYALDRKRYERDVQRNTAPEINTKAAEAVEAVTRGETITGNQAAAIARDPVAVEVLEQRTGVKLDTDKPISQVKRDIAGLASREVTQEAQRATPPSPAAQKRAERRVGGFLENGQKAYQEMSQTAEDAPSLYAGFSSVYNAGLSGIEADKAKGKYAAMLTPEQRYAAYNAGLEDARAQLAQENAEVASVTTTAGAGLADNEYSRGLIATKKDTAATLNAWGKKLGVRIEIVDQVLGGRANGQYIKEQNLIQIAADSDKPLLNVTAHEITHRMQDLSPAEYRNFRQAALEYRMQQDGADTMTKVVKDRMDAAERDGVTLTQDEVMDEIAADFAGDMLDDADLFAKFSKENRTAAQKLLDSLKEFLNKVRGLFTGKYRDMAAQEAYGKDFSELEDIAKQWQAAFDAAEQQAEKVKTAAGEGDGAKYQIKQFPNGMKYVQADRQVLFGNDPKAWSEQLESYINGKIRNHEDVRLIAEDGDVLLLTSKSAGKLSSIYDNNGRTLDEKAFERKANAVAHIDELIKVSERGGKTVLDFGGRHGDMAKDGWNYRTAYFMDFDGKYYRTRISVALGKDGSIVYNIGEMQERSTPQINGSSGNSGAQWGNASDTSIPADGENVKPKFSLKATDSTGRKLSEQQQEFFKDSKVRDAEGRLKTVYHGSSAQFTKFSADFMSTNGSSEGQGFYFTDFKAMAQGYEKNGGQLLEGYLDIKNPLSDSEVTLSNAEVKRLIKAIDPTGDDLVLNYDSRGGMGYPSRTWYNRAVNDTLRMTMETSESDSEILAELANGMGNPGAVLKAAREVLGYDGYIVEGKYDDATVYVAFDSSQFKNVDNLTPTSDPDIRFSLKATAEVEREARELKKERNALAKQNEALKQRVQELKGEMRISKEPSVVARDVKKLGQSLIREYGSDVKYADVQSEMDALAKAVMKRDVTMEDLMPHAKAVAEAIVDNTSELTEYGAELLEIRDYLKRQTIQFNGDMANYGDFRKGHMGTLKLNKDNGTSVDTVYGELTEMFGEGYFPSNVYTEADKLLQIGDVLDGLDSIYHNPFEGYRDAAVQEIANQLVDGMISDQVRQKKTYADRRALEKQEAVGRVREMLSRERQKRRDDVNALRKTYNEKTKKGNEKRKATAMRARIARHTGAISRKLVNPTDKQHIPERLRVTVASLLQNINLESAYSYDENGRLRKNADGDPTRRTLEADRLKQIYDDILDNEGNMVVDPALTESGGLLDSLSALGGKRIADMNVSELETVWNAIRAIETTLTTYDKTLSSAKYERTSEWADQFAADSMGRQRRNRKISLDMADPYTFFSAYGDAGKQVYRTLRNAQDQQHWMLTEVQREAEKFLDKNVYKNRFDRHTFTTGRGVELTLTTDQIMNLYNLARRGEQAMHHLTVGGIVQPEIQRNGKLKAIPRGNDNILLTEEDIKAITSVLTPEQVKVANGLQKLASTKLAEWGNNASMQVYGYRKFKEEHYWPIKAAKDAVASSVEKDADNARSIKNMGSAKALTPNASNALDIGGAYDVFAQNASDMIKYATLLAPMEDINRLYNYRYRDSSGNLTGRNMQQVLSGVYGDAAQKYWRNLMRDMQNGMVKNASDTTRAIERIVGNTKGAAVGANWRVVIQQPTAFFRAAVILDPENMAKGIARGVTDGNGWDKARKWAAIAGIKDSSGFDQGSRYTIAREVYGSSDSIMDKLSDWSSRGAANADAITWGKIWNACEWQVASDTKTEVGSDAYYRQVAELFTDVIDQTQVVDGIMQRTQIMRDSDALTRQATSFMGEPLKSLNILMRSYDAWRFETNTQKRSAALKQLKRSVGALLVTDILNSLAQSLVDALRDDDKEKKYWARFFAALTGVSGDEESFGELAKNVLLEGNLKGNITLVGRLPYAKDLISILQGYSVERMDADAIGDIVRATQTMYSSVTGKGKYTTAYACKQLLTAVSKIFGVSVANLGRDVWALARSIANGTDNVRIMFEMEKAIYRMDRSAGNKKNWCELLYRAQKENDTETARLIYKEMLEHGYDEKDVRQGIETIMKKEQGVESVKELKNRWRAP